MKSEIIHLHEIEKYGAQFAIFPYYEMDIIRYKIVMLCNKKQMKVGETHLPLSAIQILNDFFVKYSGVLNKTRELLLEKFEEQLLELEEIKKNLLTKVEKVEKLQEEDNYEELTLKELCSVAKEFGLKKYSYLSKEDLLKVLKGVRIEKIKGKECELDVTKRGIN